jgi:hypothetical protein
MTQESCQKLRRPQRGSEKPTAAQGTGLHRQPQVGRQQEPPEPLRAQGVAAVLVAAGAMEAT